MIKLKTILKEGKVWERNFGEPLPTLDSVMKKHQENKLKEEKTFKAKSKETGRTIVYKSKDSMDKAIKGGTVEPLDKKTSGKPEKVKGADLFKKDKPKLDPKQKQRAQDDYNDAIRNIKNPLMAGGIEPYYVDMAADNLKKLGNPDAKVFKDLGKEFRDNLDDDGNPKDEKLDKQIQDKIKQAALDLETDITKNEGVIKLKTLLKETKVWERKFGEPLPTLDSVMKKHQENKLNESPVSVLKPARVEKNSIVYGYITLQPYYNQIKKTWKQLDSLLNSIDYVAIDFDDRDESLKNINKLGHWKDDFIREPMLKSFKNFNKFVNNPKNMKDPKRVQNAIKSSVRKSALPKWIQLTNLYKQYLKFNNKKISSVFPETKGKKIGERLIGDLGGFKLTEPVHKLFTNQSGFTQQNLKSAFGDMDSRLKHRYNKMIVQGARN